MEHSKEELSLVMEQGIYGELFIQDPSVIKVKKKGEKGELEVESDNSDKN